MANPLDKQKRIQPSFTKASEAFRPQTKRLNTPELMQDKDIAKYGFKTVPDKEKSLFKDREYGYVPRYLYDGISLNLEDEDRDGDFDHHYYETFKKQLNDDYAFKSKVDQELNIQEAKDDDD